MWSYINLIIILSFSLAGDSLFNVAVIWRVLAQGGSAKSLGIFICVVMFVTFLLQEFSGRFKTIFQRDPRKSFAYVRITGVICTLILLPLLWNENFLMLYLAGMIFAILNFLTMITVEAIMAQEVLQGRINANKASRILQTSIQISAFLGASIAGFVLSIGNMKSVLIVNVVTYAAGGLFFTLLAKHSNSNNDHISTSNDNKTNIHNEANHQILWLSFIGLTFLTIQISSFNFLVPIISQIEKSWTATQFGYIDAAAGLGAFLCALIATEKNYISHSWLVTFIVILICNSLFHFLNNAYLVIVTAFILGFFINSLRIKLREFMYESVSNTQEILIWTGRITAMSALMKAFMPLLLAFIVIQPSLTFLISGLLVSLGLFLVEITYLTIALGKFRKKIILSETA